MSLKANSELSKAALIQFAFFAMSTVIAYLLIVFVINKNCKYFNETVQDILDVTNAMADGNLNVRVREDKKSSDLSAISDVISTFKLSEE